MYNFQIIITLDYEIHGNGDGCPMDLMVKPTYRIINLFYKYGAKLTIMADVAEILKFKEYKDTYGVDKYYYEDILKQLKLAVTLGHDVQLHIHSGYFNSEFTEKGIRQKWAEYDLANLPYETIFSRIKVCKNFLETELQKVKPNYKCIAFRAANWSMVPTKNISRALVENGIFIDSSIFKWGKRSNRVLFDYTNAHDKLIPWYINENEICEKDPNGKLLEIPIYTEHRSFWAFVTFIRAFRIIRSCFHKHDELDKKYENNYITFHEKSNITSTAVKKSKLQKLISPFTKKHAWKLDLNQASGKQIINAVKRIEKEYTQLAHDLPIVLIGHSKSFIKYNEKTFKPFLKYIKMNNHCYSFSLFSNVRIQ